MPSDEHLAELAIEDVVHLWHSDEDEDERRHSLFVFGAYVDYLGELGVLVSN